MRIVNAVEKYSKDIEKVRCFLAGGITNCQQWQSVVLELLSQYHPNNLVIFNPRRDEYPHNNPDAEQEQIRWEFNHLNECNLFTMYFASGTSLQPICMYELGRQLLRLRYEYPNDYLDHIVVSVEDGYSRKNDVIYQCLFALDKDIVIQHSNPEIHAREIYEKYKKLIAR